MAGFSREPNATAWFSPCLGRSRIWLVGRRLFPDIRGSTCSSAYARYRDSELASCLGRVRLAENQKREPTRACGATAISRRDAVPGSGSGVILATARRATQTRVALIVIQIAAGFGLNSTKMVNGSSVKKPHNMPKTSQKPRSTPMPTAAARLKLSLAKAKELNACGPNAAIQSQANIASAESLDDATHVRQWQTPSPAS